MFLHRYIAIAVCVLCFSALSAQIEVVAPTYSHIIAEAKQPQLKRALRQDTLPFVDDFAVGGPFPNQDRWVDNYVYVNTDLAVSPPSIGVATFDGIDNTGSPYGTSGAGDTLTSAEINLEVIPDDLHLSYFIQPRGFGEQPETNDNLVLEFKNDQDEWIEQRVYNGPDSILFVGDVTFMFDFVRISSTEFLHADFQFRFRNISSGAGAVDMWHLDMVRLLNNREPSPIFQDVAFQNRTEGILARYSAMPARQFRSNTSSHLRNSFTLNLINHDDDEDGRPIGGPASVMQITELNSGQSVLSPTQFLPVKNNNIDPQSGFQLEVPGNFSVSSAIANSSDELLFETMFTVNPTEADNDEGLLDNNVIRTQTVVDDYFAYDDGISEMSILAQGPGTNIAVEFETTVADTLTAVSFQFPHINGDVTNQFFNLKVWLNDLTSEPVFFGEILNPLYVDRFVDTLQAFTTYRLEETFTGELQPVVIPANTTFYVGWEQVSNEFVDAIPVGLDINAQNVAQYNWFSTNEVEWFDFQSVGIEGAVVVRPIMGVENAIQTSVEDTQNKSRAIIYPNPNKERLLNVKLDQSENQIKEIRVLNLGGRLMRSQEWQSNQIDLQNLPSGIYFINFVDDRNNIIYREKLILQE